MVIWMRNILLRLRYTNSWTTVGNAVSGDCGTFQKSTCWRKYVIKGRQTCLQPHPASCAVLASCLPWGCDFTATVSLVMHAACWQASLPRRTCIILETCSVVSLHPESVLGCGPLVQQLAPGWGALESLRNLNPVEWGVAVTIPYL